MRSKIKFAVVVFPGSNCDRDAFNAVERIMEQEARFVWHKDTDLGDPDVVILPGGFSYGDYLRCGAIARFSPVMKEVVRFANHGGVVLGICNGFQILTEAGLLPGALLRNESLRFVCMDTFVRVERSDTIFTESCKPGEVLKIPVAHGDGNYYTDEEGLKRLEDNGQILFRYCSAQGKIIAEANPNGSVASIAGIVNTAGNVMGLMPHPERAVDPVLGRIDGRKIFGSLIHSLVRKDNESFSVHS
ncbi:MAG: phosphoribosylformylglycinamidine synthase subunit PurQ [Ignavibacteria bacterium]|nr:phosphoribosylformylglycinamidine synthase subunit PurQ [Ignavibacteria bacterium]